jgi:hypothetical protein
MTIKTQGGKVLTKDGKVSCECCEEPECCPYPAVAFAQGLYTADDLPDEVTIAGVLAYKQEGGFPRYVSDDGDFFISDPSEDNPPEDALWGVTIFGQSQFDLSCLISSYEGSAPLGVEDTFADTYTVTIFSPIDNAGTYTVTRRSLCVWSSEVEESGEPSGVILFYADGPILPGIGFTWELNFSSIFQLKDGNANTPVGNYNEGESVIS